MQDQMQPDNNLPQHGADHEGAMAKADLFKLANYSVKLFKQIEDGDQLEAWVQAKITKAADYVASVYHYLEYEMKFNEYGEHLSNAEVMTEGQTILKNKLVEAKAKVKELKKLQAEKLKDKKKVEEGVLSGGDRPCTECGGTGMVYEEPKAVPDHVKSKVEKYKRLTKATHAAHKRLDRNNNGIPDSLEGGEEVTDEDQSNLKKVGDTSKTAAGGTVEKTSTGIKHTRDPNSYTDDSDSEQKSGKGIKSHAKSQSAAEKKEKAPAQKMSPKSAKTWGMKDSEKFDNRDGAPAKPKKEKAVDEMFGQGVYEAKLKGKQTKLDADKDGDIEADDLAALRAKKKDSKVSEAVKKAKKDYDKDGKIESEKDEVIGSRRKAAGLDEAKAVEVIAENTDLTRVKQFLTRLNG